MGATDRDIRLPHGPARHAALLVLLATLFFGGGFAAGQVRPASSLPGRFDLEQVATLAAGGIALVTAEQVLAADPRSYVLIDVRGRDAYNFAHAIGAVSMPEAEMTSQVASLPRDRTLVLYCTCPDDKTSLRAARTLVSVFHRDHVVVLTGGLLAFRHAGGALSSDATDSAIEHQGCGCNTNAPAFKLWAVNQAEARLEQRQSQGTKEDTP
jgi:rhodanese-related sulfurtransferase